MANEEFVQRKYSRILGLARIALLFASKTGGTADIIVLEALESARNDEFGARKKRVVPLSVEVQKALAAELVETCRRLFDGPHVLHVQRKVEEFFNSHLEAKPTAQEATTSVFALVLWYRFSAGELPELDLGKRGRKKALFALAEQRRVSGQNLYTLFNAIPSNQDNSPKRNLEHIRKAAEELAEYPAAHALALADIESYTRKQ